MHIFYEYIWKMVYCFFCLSMSKRPRRRIWP